MTATARRDTADYIRSGPSRARSGDTPGLELANVAATAQQAIQQIVARPPTAESHGALGWVDSVKHALGRSKLEAVIAAAELGHEERLRLRALDGEMMLLNKRLDAMNLRLLAAQSVENLTGVGQLIRAVTVMRNDIKLRLFDDRFKTFDSYVAIHASGRMSDDELDRELQRITADYAAADAKLADEVAALMSDIEQLLRPRQG